MTHLKMNASSLTIGHFFTCKLTAAIWSCKLLDPTHFNIFHCSSVSLLLRRYVIIISRVTSVLSTCGSFDMWFFQHVVLSTCGSFSMWLFHGPLVPFTEYLTFVTYVCQTLIYGHSSRWTAKVIMYFIN